MLELGSCSSTVLSVFVCPAESLTLEKMTLITVIFSWSYFENHPCLFRHSTCSLLVILCVCARGRLRSQVARSVVCSRGAIVLTGNLWLPFFFYTINNIIHCMRSSTGMPKLKIIMLRNARNWGFLMVKAVTVQGAWGEKLYLHRHVVLSTSCIISLCILSVHSMNQMLFFPVADDIWNWDEEA